MPKMKQRVAIGVTLASVGALALVGALVFMLVVAPEQREQSFLDAYAEHPGHVEGLSDTQLVATFEGDCEQLAAGLTLDDKLDAARTNWEGVANTSQLSRADYLDNVTALWEASKEAC